MAGIRVVPYSNPPRGTHRPLATVVREVQASPLWVGASGEIRTHGHSLTRRELHQAELQRLDLCPLTIGARTGTGAVTARCEGYLPTNVSPAGVEPAFSAFGGRCFVL